MTRIESPNFNASAHAEPLHKGRLSKTGRWTSVFLPIALAACQAVAEETPTPNATLDVLQTQVSELRDSDTKQTDELEKMGTAIAETLKAPQETQTAVPTATPTPTRTATAFPSVTPTPGELLGTCIVEDNSGFGQRDYREDLASRLKSKLPNIHVETFDSYEDLNAASLTDCDILISDFTIEGGINALDYVNSLEENPGTMLLVFHGMDERQTEDLRRAAEKKEINFFSCRKGSAQGEQCVEDIIKIVASSLNKPPSP